jgi:phage tail protein X
VTRIARARKGETIDELTARLFRVADPNTGMKAATEQLVAANRHLALKGRGRARVLADDAVVVVPEVAGAEHDRRTVLPFGKAATRALLKSQKEALEALGPAMEAAHRDAVSELEATLELAGSEPLQSAATEDADLARRLDFVRDWTKGRLEVIDRARDHQAAALERASQTITELLDRVTGT